MPCLLCLAMMAWSSASVAQGTGPPAAAPKLANANVTRWIDGAYEYRALADGKLRGRERFLLTVHPDGSRTMRAFTDIFGRDVTANVVLRADAAFKPVDAFVSIWTQGKLKGSGMFALDGVTLHSVVNGPAGPLDRKETVPADLSYATHPLALDGWHRWMLPGAIGQQGRGTLLNVQGDADFTKPMTGRIQPVTFVYRGEEDVQVPAGKFRAHHFVLEGDVDIWLTLPDRILVRSAWPRFGSEYVLSRLVETPTGSVLQ